MGLYNLIAEAVEGHKRVANEVGNSNLAAAMEGGTLAVLVEWVGAHESYCGWNEPAVYTRFVNTDEVCWDGCDGILTFHRPGYCRTNPSHADYCACGESDHEDWYAHDEGPF
jgi:hypothetical protein